MHNSTSGIHSELHDKLEFMSKEKYFNDYMAACKVIAEQQALKPQAERAAIPTTEVREGSQTPDCTDASNYEPNHSNRILERATNLGSGTAGNDNPEEIRHGLSDSDTADHAFYEPLESIPIVATSVENSTASNDGGEQEKVSSRNPVASMINQETGPEIEERKENSNIRSQISSNEEAPTPNASA